MTAQSDDGHGDDLGTGAAARSAVATEVAAGYAFDEPSVELGALLLDAVADPAARIRIPVSMMTRHGLIAGATGTGKTKTLQLMAEQLSTMGVPVFAADIKGDLSGIASPGLSSDRVLARASAVGQTWASTAYPSEVFSLGGDGVGIPLRASISSFGPVLLSKVLGLTEVQESSLGLVFHYADVNGLPLLDIKDLRAVIQWLVSDEGRADLEGMGGLSKATAGVLLRELVGFVAQGADRFFGEPEFATADLLRTAADGRGVVSLLELPGVQDKPQLFSTFLMWLLADLFHELPEVGDVDKPKLVFFFDEAHLLFTDASKDFLTAITQTVRLIRSKGVGVFFVTQTPTDVPDGVLAQLGSRVQHQLRAHTPNDTKALRATVSTYPHSAYDLAEVLTQLGIGEAIVTVMDPDGAPTPVARTQLQAPQSLMAPSAPDVLAGIVSASSLRAAYEVSVDRESAYEVLMSRLEMGAAKAQAEKEESAAAGHRADAQATAAAGAERARIEAEKELEDEIRRTRLADSGPGLAEKIFKDAARYKTMDGMARSVRRSLAGEIARGVFGIARR